MGGKTGYSIYKLHNLSLLPKSASLVLAFFLLLHPVATALAEEAESVEVQTSEQSMESAPIDLDVQSDTSGQNTTPESSQSTDSDTAEIPVEEEGEQSASSLTGADPVNAVVPAVQPGNPLERYGKNNLDGSFGYTYPLSIPPGRNNLQPNLTLSYSSANNDVDAFGYGWSMNIPYIQRLNKTGVETMLTSNTFYSSLSGELVQVGSTTQYRPKIETGDFLKYVFSNNIWTVTDKVGTVYTLGSTTASRQDNSASTTQIFKWMVNDVRDTNANYIKYTYYKSNNQIYPDTITYTGSNSTDGIFTITFSREAISYNPTRYDTGFAATTTFRINEIRANINGLWSRKYTLAYADGDNGGREILNTVTESGRDEVASTTVTLPAVDFDYQTTMSDGWSANNTSWVLPEGIVEASTGDDAGTRFADINGDGYQDIVRYFHNPSAGVTIAKMYFHDTSTGWVENTTFNWSAAPLPFTKYHTGGSNHMNDLGSRLLDLNGDGLADLVVGHYNDNSHDIKKVFINTGTAWVEDPNWVVPTYITEFEGEFSTYDAGVRFADINGDDLPDYISSYLDNGGGSNQAVYLNTGSSWVYTSNWVAPEPFSYCAQCTGRGTDLGTNVVDVNGDGLADFVRGWSNTSGSGSPTSTVVYLNTGNGWASSTWSGIPFFSSLQSPKDKGMRMGDINGDGLIDLVQEFYGTSELYINTGTGWTTTIGVHPPGAYQFVTVAGDVGARLIDIDADGLSDIVQSTTGNVNVSGGGTLDRHVYINTRKMGDLMSEVTTSQGGTIGVAYKSSAQFKEGSVALNRDLPFVIHTVATTTYDSGFGNTWVKTYIYSDGDYYYSSSSIRDRRFAGFGKVTETTDIGKTVTYQHQANGNSATSSETGDDYPKIGFVYRIDTQGLASSTYKIDRTNWATTSLGTSTYFVKKSNDVSLQYDGDADHKDVGVEYVYNDTNGNLSTRVELGEVAASVNGTYTDTGSDKRTTSYGYATNTTLYIIGLPQTERVDDQSGIKVRETRYYYDTLSLGSTTKGNLTKKEQLATSSTYVSTQWAYNSYGLKTSETDPRNYATTYTYETSNLYPATTTNTLSHVTVSTYDYSSGKVATTTDPNSRVWATRYDAIDRPSEEKIPDPASGSPVTKAAYAYTDTAGAVSVYTNLYLNSATSSDVYDYFDGFGRKVQTRAEAESARVVRDYVYDDNGLLEEESLPYFSAGSSRTSPTNDDDLLVAYTYDPLGRIATVTNAVGSTGTSYDQWIETVTDSEGNQRAFTYDAFGRLGTTTEYEGASTYNTKYQWDANNNLATVTDALGNIRSIQYDNLNRRIQLQDLHAVGDTTFGVWVFAYDASGNLGTTTDPKGQVIVRTFDGINRLLTENYTSQSGTEITNTYDTCTNGKGLLCQAVSLSAATTSYSYTPNGLIDLATTTIATSSYVTNYDYDRLGNQTRIVNPDNSETTYIHNTAGQLEIVRYKDSGGAFQDVIKDFDYGPHGLTTYEEHGNGASTTKIYDSNELYRLRNLITSVPIPGGGGGEEHRLLEAALFGERGELVEYTFATMTDEVTTEEGGESIQDLNDLSEATSTPDVVPATEAESAPESTTEVPETPANTTAKTETSTSSELGSEATSTSIIEELSTTTKATSTSTEVIPESTILPQFVGADDRESANLKAAEVAKIGPLSRRQVSFSGATYDIEVVGINQIEGGVEVFARAWTEDGTHLGFGKDGSVDIERFRIFSPRVLVEDPEGEIVRVSTDQKTDGYTTVHYRLDPEAAMLQTIVHAIKVKHERFTDRPITEGKVGNTTDIYYSNASGDGAMTWNNGTFANNRAGTGSFYGVDTSAATHNFYEDTNYSMRAVYYPVDTSSIPASDTISSATFSLYGDAVGMDTPARGVGLLQSNQASSTALVQADWVPASYTEIAARKNIASLSTGAYNDYTLTDLSVVAKGSGFTKLMVLNGPIIDNDSVLGSWYFNFFSADQTGTSNDPKLTVEHTAADPAPPDPNSYTYQHLTYIYDTVGNITKIVDRSAFSSATTTYAYDDLYRLTTASTTQASSTPYSRTYTYNAIGNIDSSTNKGAYTYAGHTGSLYANPHAVTSLGGSTYTYDRNGNLASTSATKINTWSYRNELTKVASGTASTTYTYDTNGGRVTKKTASSTTSYAFPHYEITGATTTRHIYANGSLVATVEKGTGSSTAYHVHRDHLDGTNVVTNPSGTPVHSIGYYPFGDIRLETRTGAFSEPNQYIGQDYDAESQLNYLNARYYESARGQFLSQDPVFGEIGLKKPDGVAILKNPQAMNSYSYSQNNPIIFKDPSGRAYWEVNGQVTAGAVSANFGFKVDFENLKMDLSYGLGPATGGSISLTAFYDPDDLPKQNTYFTQSADAVFTVAPGVVAKGSTELLYTKPGTKPTMSVEANIGAGTGYGYSTSLNNNANIRIFDFSKGRNNTDIKSAYGNLKSARNALAKGDYKAAGDYLRKAKNSFKK